MLKKFKAWLFHSNALEEKVDSIKDLAKLSHPYYVMSDGECCQVSKGELSDVDAIMDLQRISYGNLQWARTSITRDIAYNATTLYFIVRNIQGEAIAFIGSWMTAEEVHISNLCVHPDYQGNGLASFLINELALSAANMARSIYTLEVRVSNVRAIKLYQRLGFHIIQQKIGYYLDNQEDAYVMLRQLGGHRDAIEP